MDNSVTSSLLLQRLVFDKIEFERKGFKNENKLGFKIQIQIGVGNDNEYKVTLVFEGEKEDEYHFLVSLTGFFKIDNKDALEDKKIEELINKNAVAILMPYLRSEVTLLTAQPDTDSVVLPPFNINKIMDRKSE